VRVQFEGDSPMAIEVRWPLGSASGCDFGVAQSFDGLLSSPLPRSAGGVAWCWVSLFVSLVVWC
jgi:hypothetical protein